MKTNGHFSYFGMVFEGHRIRVVRSPMLTIRHLTVAYPEINTGGCSDFQETIKQKGPMGGGGGHA